MNMALFLAVGLPLLAAKPLSIAAVERRGWPPYEDDRRIYVLVGEGVAALRIGETLQLRRGGERVDPGRLKVLRTGNERAEAVLEFRGTGYPLRGDLAEPVRANGLPLLPIVQEAADLRLLLPRGETPSGAPPVAQSSPATPLPQAAPTRREPIYFLENDGVLSPKGHDKVRQAVTQWGAGGRWILAIPTDRLLPGQVRTARVEALRRSLLSAGVARVEIIETERQPGDRPDTVYLERR
ncbi:MAG: hypothetical protein HY823_13835 [Acidobacteria bacterium]|nr:hypothetical protein [Acidobacteriota bacterium]